MDKEKAKFKKYPHSWFKFVLLVAIAVDLML